MIALQTLATLGLNVPFACRRDILCAAAFSVAPAQAYDAVPAQSKEFAALEKKRLAREEMLKKNAAKIKPYLQAVSESTTPQAYSDVRSARTQILVDSIAALTVGRHSGPACDRPPRSSSFGSSERGRCQRGSMPPRYGMSFKIPGKRCQRRAIRVKSRGRTMASAIHPESPRTALTRRR